jgi:hypothetical protein
MALIDLWQSEDTRNRKLFQLITFAGNGKLGDGNSTSEEFRALLPEVSVDALARFADECLSEAFEGSGFALQDIINEAGRRLGYHVAPGYYQGRVAAGNQDALWTAPDGWKLVIETKTTATYQIHLGKIAGYRDKLLEQSEVVEDKSSILIIVGREKTDDFEAQIRGSRYAWIVRMISVRALFRLLRIGLSDSAALQKVHRIFVPQEYTKVDGIIDLVFETAEAARVDLRDDGEEPFEEQRSEEPSDSDSDSGPGDSARYLTRVGADLKGACIRRAEQKLGVKLTPQSGSFFVDKNSATGVMCAVSSRYRGDRYWFAFHDRQQRALEGCARHFIVLGCGAADSVLCLEYDWFKQYLGSLNASKSTPIYYHIHIDHVGSNWEMRLKGRDKSIDVTAFLL